MLNEVVAIIPARGGSKGIPRKNVMPLGNIPLIGHTIKAARASQRITRTIVSTDDQGIAAVAQQFGAEVIRRPAELADDVAKSEDALIHALSVLSERDSYTPDLVVFLQCTSPFTTADDIDGTIEALINKNADTALAVTPFHYFL